MSTFLRTTAVAAAATLVVGGAVVAADLGIDRATGQGDTRALVEGEVGTPPDAVAPADFLDSLRPDAGPVGSQAAATRVILSRDPFAPVIPDATTGDASQGAGDQTAGDQPDGQTSDDQQPGGQPSGDQQSGQQPSGDQQSGGQASGDQQSGGRTSGGGTSGQADDACTGDEDERVCDGVAVTLEAVEDGGALVTVNGVTYPVEEGDDFAGSFRVLAVNEPCTTLQYGDEAFSICVGATVLK